MAGWLAKPVNHEIMISATDVVRPNNLSSKYTVILSLLGDTDFLKEIRLYRLFTPGMTIVGIRMTFRIEARRCHDV